MEHDEEIHKCSQCEKVFSTKSSLQRHVKTANYCSNLEDKRFNCNYCTYKTNLSHDYTRHLATCKIKKIVNPMEVSLAEKDQIIKDQKSVIQQSKLKIKSLKKEIAGLKLNLSKDEGKIEVYKERPGVTNNHNQYVDKLLQVKCDTIRPFTIETVREDVIAGKYTFDIFIQGEKGLIKFIANIISQDDQQNYVCTDSSRHRFHRLLESREWKTDNGATFLNKVLDELKEPTMQYFKKVTDMVLDEKGDKEMADFLVEKTKPMAIGITCPDSKQRETTFAKIRNEVRNMATV